jgi:alpha-tubulin suppressor-like RCC1 family protein
VGTVYCWGNNDDGELGDGTSVNTFVPVRMRNADGSVLSGVTDISVGEDHSCAVLASSQVRCWGYNSRGRLGDGTTTTTAIGAIVVAVGQAAGGTPLSGVSKITAGGRHTCALLTSGGVVCWGYNDRGQLGDDTSALNGGLEYSSTPVSVLAVGQTNGGTSLSGITAIAAGHSYTCAVTSSGGVVCWGYNQSWVLGSGSNINATGVPIQVAGITSGYLTNVGSISAGYEHACAVLTSGGVVCWGKTSNGRVGNGLTTPYVNRPNAVIAVGQSAGGTPLSGIATVHAGYAHTCAKTTSGQALCWGSDWDDEGGTGGAGGNNLAPVAVVASDESVGGTALSGVSSMTVGYFFGCAVLTSGVTQCWGQNNYGEMALEPTDDESTWSLPTPQSVSNPDLLGGDSGANLGFPTMLTVTVTAGSSSADVSINLTLG